MHRYPAVIVYSVWEITDKYAQVKTHVSEYSDSPTPQHSVSGSAACGETPEPRSEPFHRLAHCPILHPALTFFTVRFLERIPLRFHLASKPRLWCFGRGAPHIWISDDKRQFLRLIVPSSLLQRVWLLCELFSAIAMHHARLCCGVGEALLCGATADGRSVCLPYAGGEHALLKSGVVMRGSGAPSLLYLATACIVRSGRGLGGFHSIRGIPISLG